MITRYKNNQTSIHQSLYALLARLESFSMEPDFLPQREMALSYVLRPYLGVWGRIPLTLLPEEIELAKLYLYADYFPTE